MKKIDRLRPLFEDQITFETLISGVLSSKNKKSDLLYEKVTFRPVMIKHEALIQFELHENNKVHHKNIPLVEALSYLENELSKSFKQMNVFLVGSDLQIFLNKDGSYSYQASKPTKKKPAGGLLHNKQKNYILDENKYYPFLFELGIMTEAGKIKADKHDKFRQLNRYLEFIKDVLPRLDAKKTIRMIDFGCGKAYLTFAVYHYLKNELDLDVEIIGLDLKEDVVTYCNQVAQRLEFKKLSFEIGDIAHYTTAQEIDMVVSLHACDTATDVALAKAVGWRSKVIFAVPCCQHELNGAIQNKALEPILKYGITRDKFVTLATDALRGLKLESVGYEVQMLEFIDMEHTPKNVMIRAFLTDTQPAGRAEAYLAFKEALSLKETALDRAFKNKKLG